MFCHQCNTGGDDSFECTKDDYKATGKVKAEVPAETKKEESKPQPDAPVEQPKAETKPEVQPEKTEPTKPAPTGEDEKAKIDAAFLAACTGKPTKGDAENSCTIHVADKTKTEDMDSVAVSKKLGDDVCPDNTVKKHDDKTKVFNCKTGTKPNRLYVKFDDIDDGDVKKGDGDNNPTNPEDKNVPVQEKPQQPNEEPGKNTEPQNSIFTFNKGVVKSDFSLDNAIFEPVQDKECYLHNGENPRKYYKSGTKYTYEIECTDGTYHINFSDITCSDGWLYNPTRGACFNPIETITELGKIQVKPLMGIQMAKDWLQRYRSEEIGRATVNCDSKYETRDNDDWLTCKYRNDIGQELKYIFKFDDLDEVVDTERRTGVLRYACENVVNGDYSYTFSSCGGITEKQCNCLCKIFGCCEIWV